MSSWQRPIRLAFHTWARPTGTFGTPLRAFRKASSAAKSASNDSTCSQGQGMGRHVGLVWTQADAACAVPGVEAGGGLLFAAAPTSALLLPCPLCTLTRPTKSTASWPRSVRRQDDCGKRWKYCRQKVREDSFQVGPRGGKMSPVGAAGAAAAATSAGRIHQTCNAAWPCAPHGKQHCPATCRTWSAMLKRLQQCGRFTHTSPRRKGSRQNSRLQADEEGYFYFLVIFV